MENLIGQGRKPSLPSLTVDSWSMLIQKGLFLPELTPTWLLAW